MQDNPHRTSYSITTPKHLIVQCAGPVLASAWAPGAALAALPTPSTTVVVKINTIIAASLERILIELPLSAYRWSRQCVRSAQPSRASIHLTRNIAFTQGGALGITHTSEAVTAQDQLTC